MPYVDFSGETVLITGGNSGLGLASAVHCLRRGASNVIITTRDVNKNKAAVDQIEKLAGKVKGRVEAWELDLTQRKSIEAFAQRASRLPRLDRALLNAGLVTIDFKTKNGIEETSLVSVYGTFHLLALLMPTLRQSKKATGRAPTLTVVSSDLHRNTASPELHDDPALASLNDKKTARMLDRYNVVKRIQVMLTLHLAKLQQQQTSGQPGVILNCCSPGLVDTGLQRTFGILGRFFKFLAHAYTPEVGACDLVNAVAAGPESYGKYMVYCEYVPVAEYVSSQEGKNKAGKIWTELAGDLGIPVDRI